MADLILLAPSGGGAAVLLTPMHVVLGSAGERPNGDTTHDESRRGKENVLGDDGQVIPIRDDRHC